MRTFAHESLTPVLIALPVLPEAVMPSKRKVRINVLLPPAEADRLARYCQERGFKKSTLIARLVREYLDREAFPEQPTLFDAPVQARPRRSPR